MNAAAKLKTERRSVRIAYDDGVTHEVTGEAAGGLIYHTSRCSCGAFHQNVGFTVTHISSGMRIGPCRITRDSARELMGRLLEMDIDWELPRCVLVTPEIRGQVELVLEGMGF